MSELPACDSKSASGRKRADDRPVVSAAKEALPSWDVLGLGCAAVDELLYVETYPAPDEKTLVLRREFQCGGLTATALVAAARLGARCAFGGYLGADAASRMICESFAEEGVDFTLAVRDANAGIVRSTVVVAVDGTRNIFYQAHGRIGAHDTQPEDRIVTGARVLLVDQFGIEGNIRAARLARRAGRAVVADIEDGSSPRLGELLALVDHLVLSEGFAMRLTRADSPAKAASLLWCEDRAAVVVTCGSRGCWFLEPGDSTPRHQPAFPVKVVDTTGCGDIFHGAYAAALARGASLADRVRFASAAAGLKAERPGGQKGIPRLEEVRAFLSSSAHSAS